MGREIRVRIVSAEVGDRLSLEENERIARVEWNGRTRLRIIIIQDPAPSTPGLTARQDPTSVFGQLLSPEQVMNLLPPPR